MSCLICWCRICELPSYGRGVDPGESFPDVSFALPLRQSLRLFFSAFGLLLAGGTQESTETQGGRLSPDCCHTLDRFAQLTACSPVQLFLTEVLLFIARQLTGQSQVLVLVFVYLAVEYFQPRRHRL